MPPSTTAETCPAATFDDLIDLRPEVVRCPYGAYEAQRTSRPVDFNDRIGGWVITRHEDILSVLRDATTFSSRLASGPTSVSGIAQRVLADDSLPQRTRDAAARRIELSKSRVLLFSDPPVHKRQRALVNAGFTPRRVAELDGAVEQLARDLIDAFPAGEPFDIVTAFSIPIPMTVIATLLGVPPSDMTMFKDWSNAFTRGNGALDQDAAAVIEMLDHVNDFYDYFTRELDARRSEPVDDLLSDLLAARFEGEEPLSSAELLQMLVQFLVAGNETTTNLLTSCVWKLAGDPDLQSRLRDDLSAVPTFIDEVLRTEAPVQGVWRVAVEETVVGGVTIPADGLIYLVTGSANRDPEAYDDPDRIELDQDRARHLSFGRGEHACLGMNLAKLEAKVAIQTLLERCSDIAMDDSQKEPEFLRSFVLHGIGSLTVTTTVDERHS
ncbi:cytochrome P450 [Gordonia sp. zg691]|uniref:cytochrome P450 n=1 Tax=Gordonia jinghuaiqii TaxID=2758710 RepID=UPI00166270E0|nr:cytochrome P450 [Gordonia jinghuaiqii]MBD0859791.1 cytochrome P450 [Gordonia jinghuaiqii]